LFDEEEDVGMENIKMNKILPLIEERFKRELEKEKK
jgi:hypothetical protein